MVDGQRVHRVIGKESDGVTRKQAETFIEKARTDARRGRLNLPKGRKLRLEFRGVAETYLRRFAEQGGRDICKKRERLNLHLIPFFRHKPLAEVSTFDVDRYKKHRQQEGARPGTINRELAVLSHLFTKAVEWDWLAAKSAIIKRLPEDRGRITYLTVDQIKRLVEAAKQDQSPHIYPFTVIGLETSMRRMEILSVRLEDIDLQRRIIYIPMAKAGAREQPITEYLATFLAGYIDAAGASEEWLFPSIRSRNTGHIVSIEKAFRRVVAAAGLDVKQVVRHTLRHTAITHLVQAGVDLPTVQRISGHKTLQMVVRYSHQNGEHIQAAMNKLDQRYRSTS
jgi:integrase